VEPGAAGGAWRGLSALRGDVGYDLRAGYPDVAAFPHGEWLAAARTALGRAPSSAYRYPDPQGLPELRTALAGYLARTRGVRVTPERVVVCAGFGQGLCALAAALHRLGARRVGVESHGLRMHRAILADAGLRLVGLPVGAAGTELPGEDVDAVLLTPAHQFPLGIALEHRAEFVQWARAHRAVLVEDDYDGEFRYDRHPVGALQSLAPDRVAYLGTASKTLAPGVRLGWLVAPQRLLDDLVAAKAVADGHSSTLDQLALADLITSGGYDRQVRRCRLAYRRRRDQLIAALRRHVPGARVTGIAAGLNALVTLPGGVEEAAVLARAGGHGLALDGLGGYHHGGPRHPPALVVGYATPPDHAYTGALARLTAALSPESGA
jgi:GntR family transcriptional regulator/MocR family aminotransferase